MATLESDVLVSVSDVREIIDTSLEDGDVKAFINVAHHQVEQLPTTVPEVIKTDIEKYLSAHFLALKDKRVESEDVGDVSYDYAGDTGMGLEATQYGQQARDIDPSGGLAQLQNQNGSISVSVYTEYSK